MTRLCSALAALVLLAPPAGALAAWIGFDADAGELVDVDCESFPSQGQVLSVTNLATEEREDCLVRSVRVNGASVELVVSTAREETRLLVMPPF